MKKLLTISGPTCSGKSTLTKELCDTRNFAEVISNTTRETRTGEMHGIDYYFVSKCKFDNLVLLEKSEFNESWYGCTLDEIERIVDLGKIPVVILDLKGVNSINCSPELDDYEISNFYIDIDPKVQMYRLLKRFSEEELSETTLNVYASRILHMVNASSDLMKHYFKNITRHTGIVVEKYDDNNSQQVLDFVVSYIKLNWYDVTGMGGMSNV